jgi:hypothetical protein
MCTVSMETVAALRAALGEAKGGAITGIASLELYEGGYRFITTGSCRGNPALTAGLLLVAQVDLARSLNLPASLVLQALPLVFPSPARDRLDTAAVAAAHDAAGETRLIVLEAAALIQRAPDTA